MSHQNPEELEKIIHRALRSLPDRRAPRTLETRVLAAIEARHSRPWWQQSFAHWPVAARGSFLLLTGMLAAALIVLVVRTGTGAEADATSALAGPLAYLSHLKAGFDGITKFGALIFRNIPSLWIYGGLAFIAAMYAALIGLSATAYRTFFNHR